MVRKIIDEYSNLPTTHLRFYYRHRELCLAREKAYRNSPEGKADKKVWKKENILYYKTRSYVLYHINELEVGDYLPLDKRVLKERKKKNGR